MNILLLFLETRNEALWLASTDSCCQRKVKRRDVIARTQPDIWNRIQANYFFRYIVDATARREFMLANGGTMRFG